MAYGLFSGLSDFVGGFGRESNTIRQEQTDQANREAETEQRALEHLANSDDPEIRSAAVTAMLTPKKGGAASGLQKWFGQQRSHPVYDQVNQLMGAGRQPYLSTEEKSAQNRSGAITGATRGYAQGMREEGYEPTQAGVERVSMGAAGAPPRILPKQYGTIKLADGTTVMGSFDQMSGEYTDQDGNYVDGVSFQRTTGTANPSQGAAWKVVPDKKSPTGFSNVHIGATGVEMARVPGANPPPPEPLTPVQTPGGIQSFGTRTGIVKNAPGGENVSAPAPATSDYETLRQSSEDMYKRASATQPHFAGLPMNDARLRPALDAEAKAAGYIDWADVQARLGTAQRAVGQRVAPPPAADGAPPEGIDPGTVGPRQQQQQQPRGAAPGRTAPRPGQPAKPKGKQPGQPGHLDIDAILKELGKTF